MLHDQYAWGRKCMSTKLLNASIEVISYYDQFTHFIYFYNINVHSILRRIIESRSAIKNVYKRT